MILTTQKLDTMYRPHQGYKVRNFPQGPETLQGNTGTFHRAQKLSKVTMTIIMKI